MTDPDANLRHLDGRAVTLRTTEPVDDADGMPVGVVLTEEPPALLHVPNHDQKGVLLTGAEREHDAKVRAQRLRVYEVRTAA